MQTYRSLKEIGINTRVEAAQFTDKSKDSVLSWAQSHQMNIYHSWDSAKNPIIVVPSATSGKDLFSVSFGDYLVLLNYPSPETKFKVMSERGFKESYQYSLN